MKFKYTTLTLLLAGTSAFAQIKVNQSATIDDTSNAFLDASQNASNFGNNIGRGLLFPPTDLSTFKIDKSAADGINYPTYFDGMIVYNTHKGGSTSDPNIQTTDNLTVGYYYFSNPNGKDTQSISNGKWIKIGESEVATAKTLYTSDGSLTGDRTIDIGNHALKIKGDDGMKIAIGRDANVIGDSSVAIGNTATASGGGSTAIGPGSTAEGKNSTAIGFVATASGGYSTALGVRSNATGEGSTVMGSGSNARGDYSTAMGFATNAEGESSTAMGGETTASGIASTAMGGGTVASAENSTAMGKITIASGDQSTAMGYQTTASGRASTTMGFLTTASGDYSTAMGKFNADHKENILSVGIGTNDNARKNAFVVDQGGNVAIGKDEADRSAGAAQLQVKGGIQSEGINALTGSATDKVVVADTNGNLKTVDRGDIGKNLYTSDGALTGDRTIDVGNHTLRIIGDVNNGSRVALGEDSEATGRDSFATGTSNTASGVGSVTMGIGNTASGIAAIALGRGIIVSQSYASALGKYNVDDPWSLFSVGNGLSNDKRSNAFAVNRTGQVAIGKSVPYAGPGAAKLQVEGKIQSSELKNPDRMQKKLVTSDAEGNLTLSDVTDLEANTSWRVAIESSKKLEALQQKLEETNKHRWVPWHEVNKRPDRLTYTGTMGKWTCEPGNDGKCFYTGVVRVAAQCMGDEYVQLKSNQALILQEGRKPAFWVSNTGISKSYPLTRQYVNAYLSQVGIILSNLNQPYSSEKEIKTENLDYTRFDNPVCNMGTHSESCGGSWFGAHGCAPVTVPNSGNLFLGTIPNQTWMYDE